MIIEINNLTFAYPGSYDNVFENLSVRLDTEWKLGLIGRNGRGKTTLMRLLVREFEGAYSGSITAPPGMMYFPIADIENLLASGKLEDWRLRRELNLLGINADDVLNRPFSTLSGGEQTKLMLAALFSKEHPFLLIDEPTNHLDLYGRDLVAEYLRSKKGFILVSHDRAFIDGTVDHVMSINKADIDIQHGNYSSWRDNRDRLDAHELGENERLKKEVKRLDAATKRAAKWSDKVEESKIGGHTFDRGAVGAQAARMMKKAKVIERRRMVSADEKRALLKNFEEVEKLKLSPLEYVKNTLLRLENITVQYDGNPVVSDVNFNVKSGDRIALIGANGTGKSSLLKLIRGDEIPYSGTLSIGSNLIISYVPQDSSFLSGDLKKYAQECGISEPLFLAILRKLGFERVQFEKDMGDYSAGQKKKVLLARSLCEKAHLFIWDEPLNYIDLPSREQLEDLIIAFEPTMLLVEHDRTFLERVTTDVIEL